MSKTRNMKLAANVRRSSLKPGTPVKILIHAGASYITDDGVVGARFSTEVPPDTVGVYHGQHPDPILAADDWHVVQVGASVMVPLHRKHFIVL